MRVLCVIPPYVPSYLNAGHHLPVFQVAAFLRIIKGIDEVVARDFAALNGNWKEVCDLLAGGFDLIAVFNDYDGVDSFERFMHYARTLCPRTRLITFGRGSKQVPGFFHRFGFDAIAREGDYEAAVAGYARHLLGECAAPGGVDLKNGPEYARAAPGITLDPDEWVLPDVREIPYAAYERLYRDDLYKFCGIPERRELVVPVARGCPINCHFCDVPRMQGLAERRLSVAKTVAYIEESFDAIPFEYVSFYAPTFTLNRRWVIDLCKSLRSLPGTYPWKCVTTTGTLDPELIAEMARAGCIRVSLGIETLDESAAGTLPPSKRRAEERLVTVADACREAGIELNCFVILGLPGDTPAAARATVEKVLKLGARVRPTFYTPYERMTDELSVHQYGMFSRQLFIDGLVDPKEAAAYHRLAYANSSDRSTTVMSRIPRRRPAPGPAIGAPRA